MDHETRIGEAFKSSEISKILLIDDAYDPPVLDDATLAAYADFLDTEAGRVELGIKKAILDAATIAALAGEVDNDDLEIAHHAAYWKFIEAEEDRYDPGGRFQQLKGPALADLRPLCTLLRQCGETENVEVRTAGLEDGVKSFREFHPDVLFVDYYLDRDVPPVGDVSNVKLRKARRASLELLSQVIGSTDKKDVPAIVLMSSRIVDDVDQYRHQVEDIMSLRFQFLKKGLVKQEVGKIAIDHVAADVLLDTIQGYLFGKVLQQAFGQWKVGAESALKTFLDNVGNLDTKDFAYLLRFRLREEGQPLSEYLEWLFGEYLKSLIDEKIDWEHGSFSRLDGNEKMEEKIEGAFEGASHNIATLFDQVRVNRCQGASKGCGYRLGDLYVEPRGRKIRTVITPNCDLVVRKGKAKVDSVLTMGGRLHTFDDENVAADDLILRNGRAYSVRWNPKDLQTYPIQGRYALDNNKKLRFLGTLRHMYAQKMQRQALTDLSSIGLPVAPAIGITATATAWIRTKNVKNPFKKIRIKSSTLATIIPQRAAEKSGHRILLRRRFVNELIDQLRTMNAIMTRDDGKMLKKALAEPQKLYDKFLRGDGFTDAKGIFGARFVFGGTPVKKGAPWLQIVLKISEEAMEELRILDPLVDLRH